MKKLYRLFEKYPLISTDSRRILPGSIFFALQGASFDGNLFASEALEKGAEVAVVNNPEIALSDRFILVEDTISTLQHLATYHRRVLGIPILAVTGSNGKTTTKELLFRVLSKRFKVFATQGNLNNHIGVPLTLLSMQQDTEFGIVEMGASARGEIELLCSIAQPDYGIVTNIGKAHLEGFGSLEGVSRGKGELYDYLASHNGLAFYSVDDPDLAAMISDRPGLLSKTYSLNCAAGIKTSLVGEYNRKNIAAAVAIGEYFGVTQDEIRIAVKNYIPDNNRSQIVNTDKNTLVMDCYNANPSSMKAALENFAADNLPDDKVVILGDMLELGQYSSDEHISVIHLLTELGLKDIYLVGENFRTASEGTGLAVFKDVAELIGFLSEKPISASTILIKGSRGIGLEKLTEVL